MIILLLMTTLGLGLSEAIELRLPADPAEVYSVGFTYDGVKVDLDWKNREIVTANVCRQSTELDRTQCQTAAINWLFAECAYYGEITDLSEKQEDMQYAVCLGADAVSDLLNSHQLADR
jgi:hypothetical protein